MLNSAAQKQRLSIAGYKSPTGRPCCMNCANGRIVMFGSSKKVHCAPARAYTSCGGICPGHEPDRHETRAHTLPAAVVVLPAA